MSSPMPSALHERESNTEPLPFNSTQVQPHYRYLSFEGFISKETQGEWHSKPNLVRPGDIKRYQNKRPVKIFGSTLCSPAD